MSAAIQVVCFDLDDTLWPCAPLIQRAEQILHQWLSIHYPRLTAQFSIADLRELRQQFRQRYPQFASDLTAARKASLALAAEHVGYDPQLMEPAFKVFHQARNQVSFYVDVLPCLQKLQRRYRLGALTNGNADLRQVGISHLFDFFLSAQDAGIAKPHPAFFMLACQRANAMPEQIVHVGDDPISDIAGALAVGMRAVWLNRQQQVWVGEQKPDAIISSLIELETWLAHWH